MEDLQVVKTSTDSHNNKSDLLNNSRNNLHIHFNSNKNRDRHLCNKNRVGLNQILPITNQMLQEEIISNNNRIKLICNFNNKKEDQGCFHKIPLDRVNAQTLINNSNNNIKLQTSTILVIL
jgi:hypothetical protein